MAFRIRQKLTGAKRRAFLRMGAASMAAQIDDRYQGLVTDERKPMQDPSAKPMQKVEHAGIIPADETPILLCTIIVCQRKGEKAGQIGNTYLAGPIDRPHLLAHALGQAGSVLAGLLQRQAAEQAERRILVTDQLPSSLIERGGRA